LAILNAVFGRNAQGHYELFIFKALIEKRARDNLKL